MVAVIDGGKRNLLVNAMVLQQSFFYICRSNHQRCSIKKVVSKNFAIFIEKHFC